MKVKRIPVRIAREIAEEMDCSQVIFMAFDGTRTHVVTYGKSVTDCEQAAAGAKAIKAVWRWPKSLEDWPASVRRRMQAEYERGYAEGILDAAHCAEACAASSVRPAEVGERIRRLSDPRVRS